MQQNIIKLNKHFLNGNTFFKASMIWLVTIFQLNHLTEKKSEENKMKQYILKLSTYGIVCAVYSMAFLFGAMYPQYGIPKESIVYETEDDGDDSDQEIKVEYRSFFLDKLRELL